MYGDSAFCGVNDLIEHLRDRILLFVASWSFGQGKALQGKQYAQYIFIDICLCVISYFYTATCGPKGHGSGLPLPGGNGGFLKHDHILSQNEMLDPRRAPLSPSLISRQTKEKNE